MIVRQDRVSGLRVGIAPQHVVAVFEDVGTPGVLVVYTAGREGAIRIEDALDRFVAELESSSHRDA